MNELEKQRAGEWYDPTDEEMVKRRKRADQLLRQINGGEAEEKADAIAKLFAKTGKNLRLNTPFHTDFGCNTYIGDDCIINMNCTFLDGAEIHIGDRVLIAPDVKIYSVNHPLSSEERFVQRETTGKGNYFRTRARPIYIGDDTWIGGNTVILPDVRIGRNVVIGAGSVVTHDIPDNVVAAGNPCRVIKENK